MYLLHLFVLRAGRLHVGARFHKDRAPGVRLSFWVYLTLLTYTFYEMVRHKLG